MKDYERTPVIFVHCFKCGKRIYPGGHEKSCTPKVGWNNLLVEE